MLGKLRHLSCDRIKLYRHLFVLKLSERRPLIHNPMKPNLFRNLLFLAVLGLFLLSSCKEETTAPETDSETESSESSEAQSSNDDIATFVENEALQANSGKTEGGDRLLLGACRNAVRTETATDSTITFTFLNVTCADGKTRSGTIYVSWNKNFAWRQTGKTVTVRSSNYTVNGRTHKFRTLHTLTDTMPQPTWTRSTTDTITRVGESGTALWNTNNTRILTTGWRVPIASRVWEVFGTTTGTSRRGNTYTSTVNNSPTERVRYQPGTCYYPTQGTITVVRSDKTLPRVITFGPGCKDTFAVTVGTLTVTLRF
jgi:hypothetical protein